MIRRVLPHGMGRGLLTRRPGTRRGGFSLAHLFLCPSSNPPTMWEGNVWPSDPNYIPQTGMERCLRLRRRSSRSCLEGPVIYCKTPATCLPSTRMW
uniref:FAD dependent oxidoreductase domain containing 1 n=1 Tax=Homo sapiens TaxID=9606 RepID=A0A8I5KPI4_HUMAN